MPPRQRNRGASTTRGNRSSNISSGNSSRRWSAKKASTLPSGTSWRHKEAASSSSRLGSLCPCTHQFSRSAAKSRAPNGDFFNSLLDATGWLRVPRHHDRRLSTGPACPTTMEGTTTDQVHRREIHCERHGSDRPAVQHHITFSREPMRTPLSHVKRPLATLALSSAAASSGWAGSVSRA